MSYRNYENYTDESSDDESHNTNEILSQFTLNDYLECNETHEILDSEWDCNIRENMEEEITEIFRKYRLKFENTESKLFKRSTNEHEATLFSIVKYHLWRDYNTELFKINPHLAIPLIKSFDDIMKKRKEKAKQSIHKKFEKSNKKFNWNKLK